MIRVCLQFQKHGAVKELIGDVPVFSAYLILGFAYILDMTQNIIKTYRRFKASDIQVKTAFLYFCVKLRLNFHLVVNIAHRS